MAASQQGNVRVAQALEKEKAKLDEIMKDAKNNLQNTDIVVAARSSDQISAMAVCQLRSGHGHQSRYYISHSWNGSFMTRIPEFINSGDGATIVHKGSKGAVIFGLLPENPRSAAWLLAWSKPDDPSLPNRVYVKGGTREKLVTSGRWGEHIKYLEEAGEYSEDYDPESGATITARISNDSDKVALVGATLNLNPSTEG